MEWPHFWMMSASTSLSSSVARLGSSSVPPTRHPSAAISPRKSWFTMTCKQQPGIVTSANCAALQTDEERQVWCKQPTLMLGYTHGCLAFQTNRRHRKPRIPDNAYAHLHACLNRPPQRAFAFLLFYLVSSILSLLPSHFLATSSCCDVKSAALDRLPSKGGVFVLLYDTEDSRFIAFVSMEGLVCSSGRKGFDLAPHEAGRPYEFAPQYGDAVRQACQDA